MKYTQTYIILILSLILASCSGTKEVSTDQKEMSSSKESAQFQELFFKAQEAKATGNPEKAYDAFQSSLALSPENDAVYYEMSRIDFMSERTEQAFDNINKAISIDPENYWYRRLRADFLMETSRFEEAEKDLEWLIAERPDLLDGYYDLAAAYLYQEDGKGALETYDKLEEQIGIDPELSFQKQRIQMIMGDAEGAIQTLDALLEVYPEPEFFGQKAQLLLELGRRAEAQQTLEDLLVEDPENGVAHLQLSRIYVEEGQNEKSWESLQIAFRSADVMIDDKIGVLFRYFDIAAQNEEAYTKSYQLLDILDEVHPNDAKTHSMYGDFLMVDQRYKEARDRFEKAVELDNSRPLIWIQMMELDAQLGEWNQLLEHSSQALELFPNQPTYYLMQGIGHLRSGAPEKAIPVLNTGQMFVVDDPALMAGFWSNLGEAYNETQDYPNSDKAFEKSLEYYPDDPFVMNNYSYYLSLRGEKLDRAAELSKKSNELLPNTSSFQDTYGWILFKQGNHVEAEQWVKLAIDGSGPSAELFEHYGDILFHLDRKEEALQYWKEALDMSGGSEVLPFKVKDQTYYEKRPE